MPAHTYTQTHIVVDHWAETVVIDERERMPKAAHAGDRCALADVDCDVTFDRLEIVFMPVDNSGTTGRGKWVCGKHIPWPAEVAFERRCVKEANDG